MKHFVQEFLDHLAVRNYSARTVADYGYHLNLWLHFLGERKTAELARIVEATVADFQRWLYYPAVRVVGVFRGLSPPAFGLKSRQKRRTTFPSRSAFRT